MIYVKITNPNAGSEFDRCNIREYLDEGKIYPLDSVTMGRCHTNIYLKDFPNKKFNSVNFTFYENDIEINIYKDKRFNPFMTKIGERPAEFYHKDIWNFEGEKE